MIDFHYETGFSLKDNTKYIDWINRIIASEEHLVGDINYIFCDDAYLLNINQQYLDHDTYTDIITFDYTDGKVISSDIYISVERVKENAVDFKVDFDVEMLRVMAHGVLHLAGYKDKSTEEAALMRSKEEEKIKLFHVEH
ncbi:MULTISPECIES: rRNA maturation RNase YbeY [unclassified Cellulophaga]|uniref:rRNA maturation RNase YbeY n=1 Tax=unclassified Cellulophaga TaxID=2634405 RepID=UPI0026E1F870|nr:MULTISPECIES: rRNA maturation RNase YbeY [unclassified Cellulophaga]MDO6491379.1 rRNA maturation RNase YbeY [Cellulophaga sp. 2_MG-2023]MDO6495088.1 rRNA maturation RNase YbeY [Cellulophaga sp. 3_MG-2023]